MAKVYPNQVVRGSRPPKRPGTTKTTHSATRHSAKPTSPLAPMSTAEIRRQAQQTMRAIYKPAFKQLGREQHRMMSISEKRKADNAYYLNWLDKQSEEMNAHESAANAALLSAGRQAQSEVHNDYLSARDNLVKTGEETPGVISDAGNATAFDTSGAQARDEQLIGNTRAATQGQIAASQGSAAASRASNFAQIAAAEASRVGDQWKALSEIGDAKQKLRLSKAGEAAKEVARLLDREVQKAQIRGQLQASSATAAIEAARFGLDVDKLRLDQAKFGFEQTKFNRKFGLEQKEAAEIKRYHNAETALKKAKSKEEKMKASHKITAIIQEGISTIASNQNLQKALDKNPNKVKRRLMQILGSATAANAAVELVSTGSLNPTTKQDLGQIGYIVPPKWR